MDMESSGESGNTNQPQTDIDGDYFEDVLNLEDQYRAEGYNLGVSDGSRAGRIEGRIFGLEKGFDKFAEMGRLGGRAAVWQSRFPQPSTSEPTTTAAMGMPFLSGNDRLRKHVDRLLALTEAETMPTENSEEAVSDFDDRLKDARAKAKLIAKVVGEDDKGNTANRLRSSSSTAEASSMRPKIDSGKTNTGEMEDFVGLQPNAKRAD